MKRIRLLTLTTINYVVVYTLLSVAAFGLFLYFYKAGITGSMNEALGNRKFRILQEIVKNNNRVPLDDFNLTDFRLVPVSVTAQIPDHYSDTAILQHGEDEEEYVQFRKLTSNISIASTPYKLEIVIPVVEKEAFSNSLLKSSILAFLLMILIFLMSTRLLSRRIWRNFYKTLAKIKSFDLESNRPLRMRPTRIAEFEDLNKALMELAGRSQATYASQKQFIENASHELQTPLAINQNKLEQLADDPDLTAAQSVIVQSLVSATQRMNRLNKTLLLLSKIDNSQFPETETICLAALINETINLFEDLQARHSITLAVSINEKTCITANRSLTELLVTNLIKNAFVHNIHHGSIHITVTAGQLQITNTSASAAIPADKLFQRFFKNTGRQESWGLGLAIVKKIAELQKWPITYKFEKQRHTFILHFN